MATVPKKIDYPTGDGKPMAEAEVHRDLMLDLIHTLIDHFADVPDVCVSGNLLMFYEEGNKRRHVSPDVFVVRGVVKRQRLHYLIWEEGKGPDFVIELTSKSTRNEDVRTKKALYRDVMGVAEYFLFDPLGDYLNPRLQGYRLVEGEYRPIEPVQGRLPSLTTGLHLEAHKDELRLLDPVTGRRLANFQEVKAEAASARRAAVENDRLRQEIEDLRRRLDVG